MVAITQTVNIPLNDQLAAPGDVGSIRDLRAVRERFEARWVTWNLVRALASVGAFACLATALAVAPLSRGGLQAVRARGARRTRPVERGPVGVVDAAISLKSLGRPPALRR